VHRPGAGRRRVTAILVEVNLELRWMTSGDVATIKAAGYLFDDEPQAEWTEKFLRQPNHHMCIAYLDDEPAGFASGIEITHPDKGTEMLLYELGVDEDFRRRGIGRSLIVAMRDYAQMRGCSGIWVPVDDDNEPALAMYRSTGPDEDAGTRVIWWDLSVTEEEPTE
jgi:ribosomal protein S18 acetylase RimI-like enzyme